MKREARRKYVELSAEKSAELKAVREKILREEKAELSALARRTKRDYDKAKVELARTAELLRGEREQQGLSLADVQDRSGISRAALCRLENLIDSNPTIATLERIAEALGKKLVVGLEERQPM